MEENEVISLPVQPICAYCGKIKDNYEYSHSYKEFIVYCDECQKYTFHFIEDNKNNEYEI